VCWSSKLVSRPVKWTATRSESLLSAAPAGDYGPKAPMAFAAEGHSTAIGLHTIASLGAFAARRGASSSAQFCCRALVGLYRIPAAYCRGRADHTNTAAVQAYRGAGRPAASYVLESLVEAGARERGMDPCEIRARNFIRKDDFPYVSSLG